MSAAALPLSKGTTPRPPERSSFGRALLVGAILEALLLGGVVWFADRASPPPPKPRRQVVAVHLVQPAPPKPVPPSPKPLVHPKPVPKPLPRPLVSHPLPRPIPHPVPKPVAHPATKPLLAKTPVPAAPVFTPPPVVTPPAPPPPAPSAAEQANAIDSYAALVRERVQANLRVPGEVRAMRLRGSAVVAFRLTPGGLLLWAHVVRPNPMGVINRAALRTVESTVYPPFSNQMPKHPLVFNVTVKISGRRSS